MRYIKHSRFLSLLLPPPSTYSKEPSWNQARDSLELNAIVNQRENEEVSRLQSKMRHKAKIDEKFNERRMIEIAEIQTQLRGKFVEVSDFIRNCNNKEKTANEKVTKENAAQTEMTAEIEKLTKDIAFLSEFKERLSQKVEEYGPYKDVIEQVLEESSLYKDKKDLIDRCDALRE